MPNKDKESIVDLPSVEQLSTPMPGVITPVPSVDSEPTAEKLPSKKSRYSSEKEFAEYKEKVERDLKSIDENLEEHFPKLYKDVEKVSKQTKTATREIKKVKKQIAEISNGNIPSKFPRQEDEDDDDDIHKSPFEKSPGLLSRITSKLKDTDGKMSIKDVLSTSAKETKNYTKESFDPLQIARFLSFDSDIAPTMLGKLTGRSNEDIEKYTSGPVSSKKSSPSQTPTLEPKDTATKVEGGMDKEYSSMTDVLVDMYAFLKKSKEDDDRQRELDKDFEHVKKEDVEKKHKELLEAIRSIGGGKEFGEDEDDEKKSGGGILDTLGSMAAGAFGKKALKGAAGKKALKGAAQTATKLASKTGGKLLGAARGILKFLQKIPGIQLIAAGAQLLFDIKDAIDQHESGDIDEKEMKKRIVESVGGAMGGAGGATLGAAIGSVVPGLGTLIGGIGGYFGGEFLGKKAAGALFDYFMNGADPDQAAKKAETAKPAKDDKPPTASPVSSASAPSPVPATGASGGGSSSAPATGASGGGSSSAPATGASASPAGGSSATPSPSPNKGSELNSKVAENQDKKLDADAPGSSQVVNNTSTNSTSNDQSDKAPIPPVRPKEDTFGRLTMYSTRTV
jgi:hypothetical protein